jgi:hypothetical protein
MKKKYLYGISVIFLLLILTFTSPVSAADFAGHSFSEEYFAVEVDLAVPAADLAAGNPDVIRDLLDASATTGDSNANEDLQFYMAYMNNSGIEVAYSAFEKFEHDITFGSLLSDDVYTILSNPILGYEDILDTVIFHINASAPFQQLVQHYTTPWDQDVFVTNNFMSLIAYSASEADPLMDSGDDLYLGYTFAVSELTTAINNVLAGNGHAADQIEHYNVVPYFETLGDDSFKFGLRYTNMFVLWQAIDAVPRGINIFGQDVPSQFVSDETGGIVFGHDIVAASVLDFIDFEYVYTTQKMTGANEYVLGTVTTHYNIGETNLLILKEKELAPGSWNSTPFLANASYTLDIPAALVGQAIPGLPVNLPSSVTVRVDDLSFYLDDDAKARIRMADGFGLTVATATTTFGVDVDDPSKQDNLDTDDTIGLQMGGNTYFFTDFAGKDTYKLKGLYDLWGIDENVDRPVYIIPFDPTGWTITGPAKIYFKVEFALAWGFTVFMAKQLTPELFTLPGSADVYIDTVLYFTFTEFPEWYGGEILHDPAYSAVSAVEETTSDETTSDAPPPTDTTGLNIPGFEMISALLALPVFYAGYRKRRS